jgi:hypothetical protein
VPSSRSAVKKAAPGSPQPENELRPGRAGSARRGVDSGLPQNSRTVDAATFTPRPASSPWILRYPHSGFSWASRRTSALVFLLVAGRPVLPRLDSAAQRRRTRSRCPRRIVSGVTSSGIPWRRAFGITLSRVASRARSAQFRFGRRGCRCCRTGLSSPFWRVTPCRVVDRHVAVSTDAWRTATDGLGQDSG